MTEAPEWPIPQYLRFKALRTRLESQFGEMERLQNANVTLTREQLLDAHSDMQKAMQRAATIEQEEILRRFAQRLEKIVARNQVLQIIYPR